ncbi:phosphate ABC transporter permease PstA [Pinisolibacter aquiterrae]|uniref:phosphate ABC transporter permease PstA n=1 Tax=Pinisolibacter aquiterrae TaxID=2815579 RepID=UPI001C3E7626|nr:phosphate ABC transporter permease PstA [Pinisolibacter aquiterrae]MBV5266087.1 phosphate ABC transporter permease PstA [Pinisolibacter aquiterrae]MCC8233620.1 phosphate ABC transporter permease PstA [Pinisolibacter aquiterrae]
MTRLERRLLTDRFIKVVATSLAVLAIVLLAWILWTVFYRGLTALSFSVFTMPTESPGRGGGLANAIVGSLIQVLVGLVIATPVGLFAGTYLSELGRGRFADAVRFINDVLLSAPSILIGLFVYELLVKSTGAFSGFAGSIALAVLILPVVVRATEDMLRLVPGSLREAAFALGATRAQVVTSVLWRAARAGIVTGILLAVARAAGETAPLLFTSLGNLSWSFDMSKPMASLPVTIYQYAGSPFDEWVALAWAGAFLITVGVLFLNILSRVVLAPRGKAS